MDNTELLDIVQSAHGYLKKALRELDGHKDALLPDIQSKLIQVEEFLLQWANNLEDMLNPEEPEDDATHAEIRTPPVKLASNGINSAKPDS